MYFVFGTIDKSSGRRRIITGNATPTVKHLTDLTAGLSDRSVDWGPSASPRAARRAAASILGCVVDARTANHLSDMYADDVIRNMADGKMWMLFYSEIIEWLTSKMKDRSVRLKNAA